MLRLVHSFAGAWLDDPPTLKYMLLTMPGFIDRIYYKRHRLFRTSLAIVSTQGEGGLTQGNRGVRRVITKPRLFRTSMDIPEFSQQNPQP